MTAVAVFCASSAGTRPRCTTSAIELGQALAARGIDLVYGGASVGLMGLLADATLAGGGTATGVITETLADHEIAHGTLSRLDVVGTMHERKARMAELSDAFIMLPGGFGTYEEFMEAVTWSGLGLHTKPCGILNVDGFFDHLLTFLDGAVDAGYIKAEKMQAITISDDIEGLLDALVGPSETHHGR
jgi:hypothetical protein